MSGLLPLMQNQIQTQVAKSDNLKFTGKMKQVDQMINDEQLMLLYAKGDIRAFEQLYARHKGGLYRYCLRQIGNEAKAEECFQEVWLKLINYRVNYQPKALFTTFLYRIAQNHIIDTFRKNKKLKQEVILDDDFSSIADTCHDSDISSKLIKEKDFLMLRDQIDTLPFDQKTTLLLKIDTGLSLDEIANVLDCGRETVKSRLRYATQRLKVLLGEYHDN